MLIRPSTKDDLAAVDALLARTYPKLLKADYPPSVLVPALPIISRARPELFVCGTYYVAEDDGAILGAGGWTPDAKGKGLGHIRHVVSDDRALRRGVGRALMERSFEDARSAGMTEMEVLVAATINAADLIDMSDDIGTIESGKFADIIAVDDSPLENIEELLDVDFVMKGGKVYKH